MSDITMIPVGVLMRSAALDMFQKLAAGALHEDPTVLFSQFKGMAAPGFTISEPSGVAGFSFTASDTPDRMCTILVASTLGVPLTQQGAPYFDCGMQYAGPDGGSIPAADDDEISYGLYAFGQVTPSFEGTEGAFRFAAQGSVLPYGLTIGWRVSFGAFKDPTYSGAVTGSNVPDLDAWCDKSVDDSGSHKGSSTLGQARVSWSVVATHENPGFTFMTILVESVS